MHKLCTLLLLLAVSYIAKAQQVLFHEDFHANQGHRLENGWTTIASGGTGWEVSDMYDLYCSYSYVPQYKYFDKVAAISGCYGRMHGPRNNSNVLAYTKSINLQLIQGGVVLKYDSYFNRLNAYFKYEKATVEVSINDGATWTVVQQVPAGVKDSFHTWYIDLSQYVGYGNVRIGFRYSDQGVDQKYGGWAIDDIDLFVPQHADMALKSFSPVDTLAGYVVLNSAFTHHGTVINTSLDTIHSFDIKYKRSNSNYVLSETINATIPPLSEYNFVHSVPDTIINTGRTDVTAWVAAAGDANHTNDTVRTFLHGAYFKPDKKIAVEEGTSTAIMFGPRGLVYMKQLAADDDPCLVSIHSQDPMGQNVYSSYLYSLKYYSGQYFLLDRQYTDPENLFENYWRYKEHFGFADLELSGAAYGDRIDIGVNVKPAVDIYGDLRLILVITEDGVTGTLPGYDQVNGYADGSMGAMGGYEKLPDPVPAKDVTYNYVTRHVEPSADGGTTFAKELLHGKSYFHKFNVKMEDGWDPNKLRAIVMLYDYNDTVILNSNKLSYFLSVNDVSNEDQRIGIYPNPASQNTMLQFMSKSDEHADIYITDISGRRVMSIPVETQVGENRINIHTGALNNGLYIINVVTPDNRRALKLQVLH